jgi:hypothetical protein
MTNTELIDKNVDAAITSSMPDAPEHFEKTIKSSKKKATKTTCENCHKPLSGPFCGQCGQQAESTLKYFWVVIMHLLDDIFSFDSRAARTIFPLIVRPGFLTNEYFAGRRVHYVPPLRLYLFISIVFFIVLQFVVSTEGNNALSINNNQAVITQLKEHINTLKDKQLSAQAQKTNNIDEQVRLSSEISKYSTLLNDINKDYSIDDNKKLIDMTRKLAELELQQFNDSKPLSGHKKERFELLTSNILKVKSGEKVDKVENIVISSDDDAVDISFNFLSEQSNKKLSDFSKKLIKKAEKAFHSDTSPLIKEVISKLPQLMFILLPLFAGLLKVMFLFSKRLYMEHLTVALHSHSFIFFTILLVELLNTLYDYSETAFPLISSTIEHTVTALLVWLPIYLFMMQKRVYKQGYFFTFIKYTFIGSAYMLLIMLTGVIAFVWGLTDI